MFKHCPDGRVVFDSILDEKVPNVGLVLGFADCGGYVGKKRRVLFCRYAGKVRVIDVCEWIGIARRVKFDDERSNGDFDSCEGVHGRQSKMAIERVDVPDLVECRAGEVIVGTRHPKRDKIAGQSIIAYRIEEMYCLVPVGYEISRYEQVGQLIIGFRHFRERNCFRHYQSPAYKNARRNNRPKPIRRGYWHKCIKMCCWTQARKFRRRACIAEA